MQYKLVIPHTLPGLNEYINAERSNKHKAAAMKREAQQAIGYAIRKHIKGVKIKSTVMMHYEWIEPNRKRDKDNISFARKFIQDSLVETGVLSGDGWKHIDGFTDSFSVDKEHPRIEITITELGG